jgi:hypothetical protein
MQDLHQRRSIHPLRHVRIERGNKANFVSKVPFAKKKRDGMRGNCCSVMDKFRVRRKLICYKLWDTLPHALPSVPEKNREVR